MSEACAMKRPFRLIGKKGCPGDDRFFGFVAAFFAMATVLVDLVRYIAYVTFPQVTAVVEPLRNLVYIGIMLYVAYLFIRYGVDWFEVIFTLVSIAAWGLSVLICPQILDFGIPAALMYFSRVYVAVILFRQLKHYDDFAKKLTWFLPAAVLYAILAFFQSGDGYMPFSYNLIPAALMYMFLGFRGKNKVLGVIGAVLFVVASFLGARGAMLGGCIGIALYFVILLFRGDKKKARKILLIVLAVCIELIILAGAMIAIFREELAPLAEKSRTLNILINGLLFSDSGRSFHYGNIMAAIKAEPFRPHGLLADRIVIAQEGTPTHMTYPHNLALEILYQWGLPLGIVLLAGILWLFVSGLWSLRHADENRLAVMLTFVPIALVQIMLSSSYLMSWLFAIAVGLLLARKPDVTTAS